MSKSILQSAATLHENVREEVRHRILSGEYAPGAAIPSTTALSEEFSVSPITVKRALRDLQSAGILTSIPGKGTFVKEHRRFIRELDVWMSSMDNARKLGFKPSIALISITKEKITEPNMSVFNPPSEAMLCVRKVIYADDMPIMYDATYVSSDVDAEIVDEFGDRFVTDALHRHNVDITDNRLVIDAAPASSDAQQVFGITNGYPMLRRLYLLTTNRPGISVYGIVESPFDRLACSVSLPQAKPAGTFE